MIAYLEGRVINVDLDAMVVLAGGVGYRVYYIGFSPENGDNVSVHIHDYIREDRHELFGFTDIGLLKLFEKLIDISGVGPKLAQKILRAGSSEELHRHILGGDIDFLTAISGVGKKTAQKIKLELKGVLVQEQESSPEDSDTIDALVSLGYQRRDAVAIIKHLTAESPEDRIREALKYFSNG